MKLSVVIPAHNEDHCLEATIRALYDKLRDSRISHEILVVNDNSSDRTEGVLRSLQDQLPTLRYLNNSPPHGFGFAVRKGLANYTGDAVAIYMADASDRPEDLVRFYETLVGLNVDCVFGTRFSSKSRVVDYPRFKLMLNRLANTFIRLIFGLRYNDVTNAFKLYRRHVIDGLQPLLSHHFNLTVELPLKAIVRGYSYAVVPNDWINRKSGESKLFMREMGSRYLFIVLYCFIEKWLSKRDYHRETVPPAAIPDDSPSVVKKLDV
jgi:dolichol-phosphate mannosyltransferase